MRNKNKGTIMTIIVLALAIFLSGPVIADDGDPCTSGSTWPTGTCQKLCDAHDADGLCGPVRLAQFTEATAFELQDVTCTLGTVKIFSRSERTAANRPWHHIGTLDLPAGNADTNNTSLIMAGPASRPMAWIKAIVENAACDDQEFTVVIHQR